MQSYARFSISTTDTSSSVALIPCGTVCLAASSRTFAGHQILCGNALTQNGSLCEILLGITCACLPAAAYGFRHKGSVHLRWLSPSHYNTSKQRDSTMYPQTPRQRTETADAESLNSRSRIRCTTCVEISTSDPESDLDGKKAPSSIEELCEERQEDKAMELNALEPLHVTVPVGRYRNA